MEAYCVEAVLNYQIMRLQGKQIIALIFLIFIFIAHFTAFLLIRNVALIGDEYHYYNQIISFVVGDYSLRPEITVIPGYHFLIATIARFFNEYSISFIRFISFSLSIFAIPIFYLMAKKIDKKEALIKTWQFSFFPIFFPFFPLIYTDILAITAVLLSLYLAMEKHYFLSGIIGFLSILIRQNNIFWLVFINIFLYCQENGLVLKRETVIRHFQKTWIFFATIFILVEFVLINGGFIWGGSSLKVKDYLTLGNVYFMFFLSFFLFLPLHMLNFVKVVSLIKKHKMILLLILLTYFIFLATFQITHPWNRGGNHLRNYLLLYFSSNITLKTVFFVPVIYVFLSTIVTSFYKNYYWLIIPMGILVILPTFHIEQRYYMVFFTLFMLFRKNKDLWAESLSLILYLVATCWLFRGIVLLKFFL